MEKILIIVFHDGAEVTIITVIKSIIFLKKKSCYLLTYLNNLFHHYTNQVNIKTFNRIQTYE